MKKRIEKYIPAALAQIRSHIARRKEETGRVWYEVNEKYDGYASSLGPTIINSGLKPAISLYTDINREERPRRAEILLSITGILVTDGENIPNPDEEDALLNYLLRAENNDRIKILHDKIMDAIVALKLAFRNFKHVKN